MRPSRRACSAAPRRTLRASVGRPSARQSPRTRPPACAAPPPDGRERSRWPAMRATADDSSAHRSKARPVAERVRGPFNRHPGSEPNAVALWPNLTQRTSARTPWYCCEDGLTPIRGPCSPIQDFVQAWGYMKRRAIVGVFDGMAAASMPTADAQRPTWVVGLLGSFDGRRAVGSGRAHPRWIQAGQIGGGQVMKIRYRCANDHPDLLPALAAR